MRGQGRAGMILAARDAPALQLRPPPPRPASPCSPPPPAAGTVCCALDPAASLFSPAAAQRAVEAYGGWGRVQALLAALRAVAERRGVSMQAVALRWQADKGCVPVLPVWWGAGGPWRSLGRPHAAADEAPAGLVAQLLAGAAASFLTEEDHAALGGLGRALALAA
jgi:hypothetical protein